MILNGIEAADSWIAENKVKVNMLKTTHHVIPTIAIICVGDYKPSLTYIKMKKKKLQECGINTIIYRLEAQIKQDEITSLIRKLNFNSQVHAILVQLKLPTHIDEEIIFKAIKKEKDADGFHNENVANLWNRNHYNPLNEILSCTPKGIIWLLKYYNIEVTKKHCVIVNRSKIVGKPLAAMLITLGATVTICHSLTQNLQKITQQADLLFTAVGKARLFGRDYVKKGAVVIDIGISYDQENKLMGDCNFEELVNYARAITPVPKGVGPMTIAALIDNVVKLAEQK